MLKILKISAGTSLVVQWLKFHLPMQGVWVQSRVGVTTIPQAWGVAKKTNKVVEFPGGPVVRTRHFHCLGPRFIPWLGN